MNKYYITDGKGGFYGSPYYDFENALIEAKRFANFFNETFFVHRAHNGTVAAIIEKD